jgi:hypothetical protein
MDRPQSAGRSRLQVQREFVRSRLEGQFWSLAYEMLVPIRRQVVAEPAEPATDNAWAPCDRQGERKKRRA